VNIYRGILTTPNHFNLTIESDEGILARMMEEPMTVFIVQLGTNLYWSADHTWQKDISFAQNFKTSTFALMFITEHKIQECHILMTFGTPKFNVCIPVTSLTAPSAIGPSINP
jgi:hypothetical protein